MIIQDFVAAMQLSFSNVDTDGSLAACLQSSALFASTTFRGVSYIETSVQYPPTFSPTSKPLSVAFPLGGIIGIVVGVLVLVCIGLGYYQISVNKRINKVFVV